jgi:hypothetical protein
MHYLHHVGVCNIMMFRKIIMTGKVNVTCVMQNVKIFMVVIPCVSMCSLLQMFAIPTKHKKSPRLVMMFDF